MAAAKLVYVIDDDPALRAAYQVALQQLGYEVKTADDGAAGEALLAAATPAVIVLDMLMPHLDGAAFLRTLRSNAATSAVKVVVVSNFESEPATEELGIAKYLSKIQSPPEAVAAAVDRVARS